VGDVNIEELYRAKIQVANRLLQYMNWRLAERTIKLLKPHRLYSLLAGYKATGYIETEDWVVGSKSIYSRCQTWLPCGLI
jgi:hypothetical protein